LAEAAQALAQGAEAEADAGLLVELAELDERSGRLEAAAARLARAAARADDARPALRALVRVVGAAGQPTLEALAQLAAAEQRAGDSAAAGRAHAARGQAL